MKHTKLSHVDKANHCLNFLEGTCSYGDRCWFLHDNTLKESDPTFKCNYCESVFKTKTQVMQHSRPISVETPIFGSKLNLSELLLSQKW